MPLYDGTPSYQGERVERTISVRAPTIPGVYYIWVGVCQHYNMDYAISGITQMPPLPAHVKVVVAQQVTGDQYEPDDTSSQAKDIRAGETQRRSIYPAGDVDWAQFTISQRSIVVVETSGPSGDTVLELYDSSLRKIAEDDDSGSGYFSRINVTLDPGMYYIKVYEYGNNDPIQEYYLSLTIRAQQVSVRIVDYSPPPSVRVGQEISIPITVEYNFPRSAHAHVVVGVQLPNGTWKAVWYNPDYNSSRSGSGRLYYTARFTAPSQPGTYNYRISAYYWYSGLSEWVLTDRRTFQINVQPAGRLITHELDLISQASASVSFDVAQSIDDTGDGRKDAYVYINVPSNTQRLIVRMTVEPDDDVDMVLYNPSGAIAGSSEKWTGSPEEIIVDNPMQGRWKLHVYIYSMSGSTTRVTVTAQVERQESSGGLEITSMSLIYNKIYHIYGGDKPYNVLRVNYRTNQQGSYTVYLLHRTTNPMLGGNAYIILEGFQINLRSEGSFNITFASTPLMLMEESDRAELVVVIYKEIYTGNVKWAVKSATYEVVKDSLSTTYRIIHDFATRDVKLLLISETKPSYELGTTMEPLGVYLMLLNRTSQNVLKSILNSENVFELPGIPEANIYVFFDRRRGPDIDQYRLLERVNAEFRMEDSIICSSLYRRENVNTWEFLNPSLLASRIRGKRASEILTGYVISIARYIGNLINVLRDLFELLGEPFDITQQYPDVFDPNKYVMLSFISVNPPSCVLSTVLKAEMYLSFPREYLTAGTSNVYVIYVVKYDDLVLHGKVSIPLNIR